MLDVNKKFTQADRDDLEDLLIRFNNSLCVNQKCCNCTYKGELCHIFANISRYLNCEIDKETMMKNIIIEYLN